MIPTIQLSDDVDGPLLELPRRQIYPLIVALCEDESLTLDGLVDLCHLCWIDFTCCEIHKDRTVLGKLYALSKSVVAGERNEFNTDVALANVAKLDEGLVSTIQETVEIALKLNGSASISREAAKQVTDFLEEHSDLWSPDKLQ